MDTHKEKPEAKVKSAAKPKAAKKPAASRAKKTVKPDEISPVQAASVHKDLEKHQHTKEAKPVQALGKYFFATGRRKSSVANIRLFEGAGANIVNKKPLKQYFSYVNYQELVLKPFLYTGQKSVHFTAHVSGGGTHSQAQALAHGISRALVLYQPETRLVLKKNGMLTRDDRKKERKKPGLKRARRAPQWAKR